MSGFSAAGVAAGIKRKSRDIALVFSDTPCVSAGVFTSNRVKGWHVPLCMERVKSTRRVQAVVANSGNANACNGASGRQNAYRMAELAAGELGIPSESVLVCSTGTIGIPLPMSRIEAGISAAAAELDPESGLAAAQAIMTTDTVEKEAALEISIDGRPVRIGGMAKGSGMVEPNMATMLAFLTTDASVDRGALDHCLRAAVKQSFNKIFIDGDQSCNDTVLIMSNGKAGNNVLDEQHPQWDLFESAVRQIAMDLAMRLVGDGEGATKLVTLSVNGAATPEDARKAVRAVARSILVRTSWFGNEPNWGRVINALGYSGAEMDAGLVDLSYDACTVLEKGRQVSDFDAGQVSRILANNQFSVNIDLNMGEYSDVIYTCDCSVEYVRINAEYMT